MPIGTVEICTQKARICVRRDGKKGEAMKALCIVSIPEFSLLVLI